MKTLSHSFYENNLESWTRLEELNRRIRCKGQKSLNEEEVEMYPGLYRKLCGDLAEARLKRLSPDLMAYLNQLVSTAHQNLYSGKGTFRRNSTALFQSLAGVFFQKTLAGALQRHSRILLTTFLLFFGSYFLSTWLVYQNPSLAQVIVPEQVLDMMEESYSSAMENERDGMASTAMFSYYIQHNTSIALISFATGIIFGLGTLYFVIYNGLLLGAVSGYVFSLGFTRNFLVFVTAHSVFELSGLVLSGTAGLLLGLTIISPGTDSRKRALHKIKKDLLSLVAMAALLIASAAVIEGFISPQPIAYGIKFSIMLLAATLEISYLIYVFTGKRIAYGR